MPKLPYLISAEAVSAEAARIERALSAGDYDAGGLPLTPVAEAAAVRDAIKGLKALGIVVSSAPWLPHQGGGVEIEFDIATDADWLAAKMYLSGL